MIQCPKNILVIDNCTDNIKYSHSQINNNADIELSLDELFDKFNQNDDPYHNLSNDIFKLCTKNALTLILSDNNEISLHEYKTGDKVSYLKLSNEILRKTDNDILIATDCRSYCAEKTWIDYVGCVITDKVSYENNECVNNLCGWANTLKIVKAFPDNKQSAAGYCHNIKCTQNNAVYQGYLPAIGQLLIMAKYFNLINYVLYRLKAAALGKDKYWSSSEMLGIFAWAIEYYEGRIILPEGKFEYIWKNKDHYLNVLPFFKRIY